MKLGLFLGSSFLVLGLLVSPVGALDPPHDLSRSIWCAACHTPHAAPGVTLTTVEGNANLCLSCHLIGGPAGGVPFADSDQALPGPGLPAGMAPSGTSHRWDSGPAGHVAAGPLNSSTGRVDSVGLFAGRYAKTYIVTITTGGDVGSAVFSWTTTSTSGSGGVVSYRDEFANIAYNGTDGSEDWSGDPWQEIGENGDPTGGTVRVVPSGLCASLNCLRIGRRHGSIDNRGVSRRADLSQVASAILSFSYRRKLEDCSRAGGAQVEVQLRTSGAGSWTTLATYAIDTCDSAQVLQSFDITNYISAATGIRFLGAGQTRGRDYIYVDDVEIEGSSGGQSGGGGGTDILTGVNIPLDEGISVSFTDGEASPSFVAGDEWMVFVLPDLDQPATPAMARRLEGGRVMCSTCHDQHSQKATPFDPSAPAYGGKGTGEGRHFQRIDNSMNTMCVDCHRARDVATAAVGSHPVGLPLPAAGFYQAPALLPLDSSGRVVCMSCHTLHFSPASDGTLLRISDRRQLCTDCHTLADTVTPAVHLSSSIGVLWPGGQYGSSFPQIVDANQRGACTNCHRAHGWPSDSDPSQDYPRLLVDEEESLCYTCHDGAPVSGNVRADFNKLSRHPLDLTSGTHVATEPGLVTNRHVECMDCHEAHWATPSQSVPGPGSAPRPAEGPIAGVAGVDLSGAEVVPANFEYEICFRCHADSPGKPLPATQRLFPQSNVRLEFGGASVSYHPVAVVGTNPSVPSLKAGWTVDSFLSCTSCHNSDSGPGAGGSGPAGPHGSTYGALLERRYETADNTAYAEGKYELCFKCHDPASIMSDQSFAEHKKHIQGEDAPCNICHNPHASEGNQKLINFDTSVVSPSMGDGRLLFIAPEDSGDGKGYCYLTCHGKNHMPKSYRPGG